MFASDSRTLSQTLVWGMVVTVLLSLIDDEAMASRRRGRGVRRPQGRVRVVQRRGVVRRRVVRRNVVRNVNRNVFRGLAVLPANGNAQAIAGNQQILVNGQGQALVNNINDFGPASVNPVALGLGGVNGLGLQPVSGFANIGVASNGQFFELNNGAVVNGAIVDPNSAIRQPLVGFNGSLVVGQNGQLLSGTQEQIRAFNQGVIPVQSFALRSNAVSGSQQVRSLRR